MNAFISVELLIGALGGLLIAMIVLLVLQVRTTKQVNKLTFPAYEYVIKKAEHDAQVLIQEAQSKAQSIVTDAEKAGQETITQYTNQATQIHETYRDIIETQTKQNTESLRKVEEVQTQAIHATTTGIEGLLSSQLEQVSQSVKKNNQSIEHTANGVEKELSKAVTKLNERVEKITDVLEKKIGEADEQAQMKFMNHLTELQKSADTYVASYQESRIALLDAHIEQLVEAVVMQVLHTQLPVSGHESLARSALEEAKSKHIL